jgi:hypothetical protein
MTYYNIAVCQGLAVNKVSTSLPQFCQSVVQEALAPPSKDAVNRALKPFLTCRRTCRHERPGATQDKAVRHYCDHCQSSLQVHDLGTQRLVNVVWRLNSAIATNHV